MKKRWSAPQVVALTRLSSDELTLTTCKIGHGAFELGPNTNDFSCNDWTGVCSPCGALAAS